MIVELNEQNFDENAAHGLKLVEFYLIYAISLSKSCDF